MKIDIRSIDHGAQPQDQQAGSWRFDPRGHTLHVAVSHLPDDRMTHLLAVQTLIEALVTDSAGRIATTREARDIARTTGQNLAPILGISWTDFEAAVAGITQSGG